MVVLLTGGLWLAVLGVNVFMAPRHVLAAYKRDKGKAKYVPWVLMIATCIGAFWASPLTLWRVTGGISLIILGTCVAVKSLHDNPFFRGDLIAPPYRVTTGLYQYFDHPGYLGFSIRYLGFALIGDNAVSGALFFLYLLFLVIRAEIESFLLADL